MKAKKTIVVDLDVVTVSMWNKKGNQVEIANAFIDRVAKREFYKIVGRIPTNLFVG